MIFISAVDGWVTKAISISDLLCTNCTSNTRECLSVYHKCFPEKGIIPLSLIYINNDGDENAETSKTCTTVSPGCYWIAVFGLDVQGRMEYEPMTVEMVLVRGKLIRNT